MMWEGVFNALLCKLSKTVLLRRHNKTAEQTDVEKGSFLDQPSKSSRDLH